MLKIILNHTPEIRQANKERFKHFHIPIEEQSDDWKLDVKRIACPIVELQFFSLRIILFQEKEDILILYNKNLKIGDLSFSRYGIVPLTKEILEKVNKPAVIKDMGNGVPKIWKVICRISKDKSNLLIPTEIKQVGNDNRETRMTAVNTHSSGTATEENASFSLYTPRADVNILVNNPDKVDFFKAGQEIYTVFTHERPDYKQHEDLLKSCYDMLSKPGEYNNKQLHNLKASIAILLGL